MTVAAGKDFRTFKRNHPSDRVVIRDLSQTELPFVDLPWVAGAYTPAEQRTPEIVKGLEISDKLLSCRPWTIS